VKTFLVRRWFLILLAAALAVGVYFARELEWLVKLGAIRNGIVFCVLFVMAFPLRAGAIWNTLRRPAAPLLASAINYGLLPLVAWGLAPLLFAAGVGASTVYGILSAVATPATLASASVWTRRAGGNDAISMVVTILTNALCFLITPMWLTLMIGSTQLGEKQRELFDPVEMIIKLALLVVLPMAIAQALRLVGSTGAWATEHKTPLGVLAQCGVLSMIFMGSIQTGLLVAEQKAGGQSQSSVVLDISAAIGTVMALHVGALVLGVMLARWLRMNRADAIAVGFAGSQKTLMVGLQVAIDLGFSAVPIVAYHVGQLLIDTVVAERYRKRTEELEAAKGASVSRDAESSERSAGRDEEMKR
jgi:sodium/bile acid cotransporter 7